VNVKSRKCFRSIINPSATISPSASPLYELTFCGHSSRQPLTVFIGSFTVFFLRSTRALQPAFISSVLAVKGRDELAALALNRSAPLQTPRGVTGFAKKKFAFKGP
jgi:hypothetical protein